MSGTDKDSVKQYNDMWKFEYAKSDGSGSWVDVTATGDSEYGMPKKRYSLAGTIALPGTSSHIKGSGSDRVPRKF